MNQTDDRAVIETARAALERSAAASRDSYDAEPHDERAMRHLVREFQAQGSATTLSNLDPTRPLTRLASEAVDNGQRALQREANVWGHLAEAAATDGWRAEFEARATEAQRQADAVLVLRQRLADRDRGAEQEAER